MKALLCRTALVERDRAMMYEHVDAVPAHAIGDALGDRARLAEEDGRLPGRASRRLPGELFEILVESDEEIPAYGWFGRIYDHALSLRRAPDPGENLIWITDRRGESHALDIVLARWREAL